MATISSKDRATLINYFQMEGGYVLDFSNRTFATFFEYFDIDIEAPKYSKGYPSDSKGNRMKGFWDLESDATVGGVLLGLIEYSDEKMMNAYNNTQYDDLRDKCVNICNELVNGTYNPAIKLGAKLTQSVRQAIQPLNLSHAELENISALPSDQVVPRQIPSTQIQQETILNLNTKKQRVFVVHGHDDVLRLQVENFIRKIGLEPVVLMDQASAGDTIIEKIDRCGDADFAVVLYTPCDVGKHKNAEELKGRARQNVVFEHGYFIARLGRKNVAAIVKQGVEIQNDIQGVVYIDANNWEHQLLKELHMAKLTFNANALYAS
ncbi:hypothetical protein UA38_20080 [Photobacterium kishitanii]|uniref:CD-NTase-associated protein 12/Pycsar effector protein TIR domain-containing protein n=1 Tax=Photobacterium kishitanii TaxID=318456 RepID=A0AAX0YTA3_9GAMM|nr:nucleotide-binding protein [Photobacterium kishitanii]KJG55383.1 hypothetical protein UA38_20080 [Photobacterium kishitanii]KJG57990.1 hypothetical protein UA42_20605 [Photobacterium kishitanii]KJG63675.1 hypothetical protein UA40_20775 [Photobacterium kishitanii]KJG66399.1 hypothetical protein UA41_20840 [Photobacterium kishitanii]PSX16845.1 hypothetical protein C0W70_22315 [Photobacterium kishitanii]